ncbi:hypothetical protein [Mycobacterium sp.]|jgi:hypothetical protein|uniref:hypothetical protein n=1 Tax=Mycobacterium sp. TaxID=1785 RepID=UPI00260DD577|nr:hypothetical protein [Mycobacterium sp.]
MNPSKSVTGNTIGWAPMGLRIALLGNMLPAAAVMRLGPTSATASVRLVADRRETEDVLVPALEAARAGN